MDTWKNIGHDARMHLARRMNTGWGKPDRVSVNLTLRCNLTCTMCTTCYDSPEISVDEVKRIIDQTSEWGVEVFNPLGGEPFMRPDLEEILLYAVQKGFYVTITTNGTLISKGRAKMLARIPSDRLHLNISLDGNRNSNDAIRGEGMYDKAIQGYTAIREADANAGNSKRKILVNSILHRQNVSHYIETLKEFQRLGFDGVQILNLFRAEEDSETANELWFQEEDLPQLEDVCRALEPLKKSGFVQNSTKEIQQIPAYYRHGLEPLDAPCWAGWKELYINADGQAIMCDGKLDFLQGSFGNIRSSSLQELWNSDTLRQRRQVVKTCNTPCVQTCYLRQESDSAQEIVGRGRRLLEDGLQRKLFSRFSRWKPIIDGKLILEFSDVSHSDWEGEKTPHSRWQQLTKDCPEIPSAKNWTRFRDEGVVDFGRGFMGFDVLRRLLDSLEKRRLQFETVSVGWRGEPLIHPEIEPMLHHLVHWINKGMFNRLEVHTSGAFLQPSLTEIASKPVPQRWIVDLDAGNGLGVDLLLKNRGSQTQVIVKQTATIGVTSSFWRVRWNLPLWVGGEPPSEGDWLWVAHHDQNNFFKDKEGYERLHSIAKELEVSLQGDTGVCCDPHRQLVISWDAKATLCTRDVQLLDTVGDANHVALADIWDSVQESESCHPTRVRG